jgi:hypothetical protein
MVVGGSRGFEVVGGVDVVWVGAAMSAVENQWKMYR